MKLRGEGFKRNKRGELVGTVIVLSDEGEPLGVEQSGNYSRQAGNQLLQKLKDFDMDLGDVKVQLREMLKQLRAAASNSEETPSHDQPPQHAHPTIQVNDRYLRDIVQDSWDALVACNDPPYIFQRGHLLVDILRDDKGHPMIRTLNNPAVKGMLDRIADFVFVGEEGEGPARPPSDVVSDMLSGTEFPSPLLMGITEAPIVVPPGVLITRAGYQPESSYYLYLEKGLRIPEVPKCPSIADIARARSLLLDDLLVDFPFVSDADRAHAVAAPVLPFVRLLIDGPTLLHLIEAPTPGSGKGILVDVLTVPAAGRSPAVMTEGRDEDEWRKRITAKLLQAPQFLLIDNVRSHLDSAALSAALTSETWEDRILGQSRTAQLPVTCTWLATANNPALSLEVARRTVPIRLEPDEERPWQRNEFKHPKLRRWARQHRGDLIWAALTLIQAWIAAGEPLGEVVLGSYESWSEVIGGVLDVAGIPGFLGNLDRAYAEADRETTAWEEFCLVWWGEFQNRPVGTDRLFGVATRHRLLVDIWGGHSDHSGRTKFGVALGKMRDRIVGDFSIRRASADSHNKGQRYYLELRRVAEGLGRHENSSAMQAASSHFLEEAGEINHDSGFSGPQNPPQPSASPRDDPWDVYLKEVDDAGDS